MIARTRQTRMASGPSQHDRNPAHRPEPSGPVHHRMAEGGLPLGRSCRVSEALRVVHALFRAPARASLPAREGPPTRSGGSRPWAARSPWWTATTSTPRANGCFSRRSATPRIAAGAGAVRNLLMALKREKVPPRPKPRRCLSESDRHDLPVDKSPHLIGSVVPAPCDPLHHPG